MKHRKPPITRELSSHEGLEEREKQQENHIAKATDHNRAYKSRMLRRTRQTTRKPLCAPDHKRAFKSRRLRRTRNTTRKPHCGKETAKSDYPRSSSWQLRKSFEKRSKSL
ncbi:uncharacterized protein LOC144629503 isoform X1 [Oculina patagonica]